MSYEEEEFDMESNEDNETPESLPEKAYNPPAEKKDNPPKINNASIDKILNDVYTVTKQKLDADDPLVIAVYLISQQIENEKNNSKELLTQYQSTIDNATKIQDEKIKELIKQLAEVIKKSTQTRKRNLTNNSILIVSLINFVGIAYLLIKILPIL